MPWKETCPMDERSLIRRSRAPISLFGSLTKAILPLVSLNRNNTYSDFIDLHWDNSEMLGVYPKCQNTYTV